MLNCTALHISHNCVHKILIVMPSRWDSVTCRRQERTNKKRRDVKKGNCGEKREEKQKEDRIRSGPAVWPWQNSGWNASYIVYEDCTHAADQAKTSDGCVLMAAFVYRLRISGSSGGTLTLTTGPLLNNTRHVTHMIDLPLAAVTCMCRISYTVTHLFMHWVSNQNNHHLSYAYMYAISRPENTV